MTSRSAVISKRPVPEHTGIGPAAPRRRPNTESLASQGLNYFRSLNSNVAEPRPPLANVDITAKYMDRPARVQVKPGEVKRELSAHSGEYNIWYHKKMGDRFTREDRVQAQTRCVLERDAGRTVANESTSHTYICLYFARGQCTKGAKCTFFHRAPNDDDERHLSVTHDIFGRERHSQYRDDMGGIGSFSRENRTLYVCGILRKPNLESILAKQFTEWGEAEYARLLSDKMIAFVRYKMRSTAEFAKEAMTDQTLTGRDILEIKWAHEDPNPGAKRKETTIIQAKVAEAVQSYEAETEQLYSYPQHSTLGYAPVPSFQQFPAPQDATLYPNTDGQYALADLEAAETTGKVTDYAAKAKEVEDLLKKMGLVKYRDACVSAGFQDLETFSQLDEYGLDAVGVTDLDDRCQLLVAAEALGKDLTAQKAAAAEKERAAKVKEMEEYQAKYQAYYQPYAYPPHPPPAVGAVGEPASSSSAAAKPTGLAASAAFAPYPYDYSYAYAGYYGYDQGENSASEQSSAPSFGKT